MTIGGLAGTIIFTPPDRFGAMRLFYVETLGMPIGTDRDGHISFGSGDSKLTVASHDAVAGRAVDPLRIIVNLHCDDVVAEHDRLRAAGVPFIRKPEQESWGGWVATFTDPDGNTVQLLQLP